MVEFTSRLWNLYMKMGFILTGALWGRQIERDANIRTFLSDLLLLLLLFKFLLIHLHREMRNLRKTLLIIGCER